MRGDDDPVKPSDLSEAEREALKRQYRCATATLGLLKPLKQSFSLCRRSLRTLLTWEVVHRRGVFWDRKTRRWRCQLGYQSKKIFLGYFDDAGEAARAYDQKLVELRGAGGECTVIYQALSTHDGALPVRWGVLLSLVVLQHTSAATAAGTRIPAAHLLALNRMHLQLICLSTSDHAAHGLCIRLLEARAVTSRQARCSCIPLVLLQANPA